MIQFAPPPPLGFFFHRHLLGPSTGNSFYVFQSDFKFSLPIQSISVESVGGGAAVRAAVKAAGMGLQNTGIRELSENFSIRRAVRPQASLLLSAKTVEDSGKLEMAASGQGALVVARELDDWDFAGYDVEEKPRLVFGPTPSLDETKVATSQFSDALDMNDFPSIDFDVVW